MPVLNAANCHGIDYISFNMRQRLQCEFILDLFEIIGLQLLVVGESTALVHKDERNEDGD